MGHINYKEILEKAESYKKDISAFLRDMIAIPSESCNEEKVVLRIKEEMEKVGFDKVDIDPMGNILGYIGHGKHIIAMDAHIDTVGVGEIANWECDPYLGKVVGDVIYGRGGSDQEGGMASMVYAGKIIKDLGGEVWNVRRGELPEWWGTAILDNTTGSNLMRSTYPDVHQSEWRWIGTNDEFNFILYNNDTIEKLYSKVSDRLST